jgi:pyruvoyl-dependent arginine decarboxylase (PvlArgDC)
MAQGDPVRFTVEMFRIGEVMRCVVSAENVTPEQVAAVCAALGQSFPEAKVLERGEVPGLSGEALKRSLESRFSDRFT